MSLTGDIFYVSLKSSAGNNTSSCGVILYEYYKTDKKYRASYEDTKINDIYDDTDGRFCVEIDTSIHSRGSFVLEHKYFDIVP